MGSQIGQMGSKMFGSPSDNGGMDAPDTASVLGGLGKIAGGMQKAGVGQSRQQAPAQPVNFAMPNQPYVPPPQMGGGMPNQFYGG